MNQNVADKLFDKLAYIESLMKWNDAMSYAHGGSGYDKKTAELLKITSKTKDDLYNEEISESCKTAYDKKAFGIYYHAQVDNKSIKDIEHVNNIDYEDMNFYIIANGYVGNGYVHCCVIAENEEQAFLLAKEQFKKEAELYPHAYKSDYYTNLKVQLKMDATKPQASIVMD